MHELAVTKSIHSIVLKHASQAEVTRVHAVHLEVGSLSDLQGVWLQRYFDRLGRGTITEGARLLIHRAPAVLSCGRCHQRTEIHSLLEDKLHCRHCGSEEITLISGREYHVKSMEAE
jgi:hydrogenase nickel incorporation protein HypA/HybF